MLVGGFSENVTRCLVNLLIGHLVLSLKEGCSSSDVIEGIVATSTRFLVKDELSLIFT